MIINIERRKQEYKQFLLKKIMKIINNQLNSKRIKDKLQKVYNDFFNKNNINGTLTIAQLEQLDTLITYKRNALVSEEINTHSSRINSSRTNNSRTDSSRTNSSRINSSRTDSSRTNSSRINS